MQLSITTDYALRVLLSLGKKHNRKTAYEITEDMVIPDRYILKVLNKLRKKGLIRSFSGNQGGYELEKELSEISLLDVMETMENTININRCLEEDKYCSRDAVSNCPVRKFYYGLQQELIEKIRYISIQDVMDYAN